MARLPIESCPEYFACENGHIWRGGRLIKPMDNGHGYLRIKVSMRNKAADKYVHRLVCEAFHGPAPDGCECRHLDGARTNNVPSNLCWSSKLENEADKLVHGTLNVGTRNGQSQLSEEIAMVARRRARLGERGKDIAHALGVNAATLMDAITGRKWKHLPGAVPAYATRRKLSDNQVRTIRRLRPSTSVRVLSSVFGVSQSAISLICTGKTYTHVAGHGTG